MRGGVGQAANRAEKRVGENLPNKECFWRPGQWKPAWRLGFSGLAARRAPVPLVGANTIPSRLTMADLDSVPIGSGAEKTVYSILGRNDRVIAIQNEPNIQYLNAEISALRQLDEMGIPVVKNFGIAHVDGRPGLVMENIPGVSSKSIYDFGMVEGGNASMLNGRSIGDLQLIRSRLEINNANVTDIQFLIGRSGRVVVNDPMGIGHGVSADDLRHIDALIDLAKKNGKR